MSIRTFKRYEDKFVIDTEQFESLKERLKDKMELDAFCKNGSYSILNIYFDRDDNEVIRRSSEKPYYKEKLRLRSYGVPESEDWPVFLELKKKIGGIVNKRRADMTYGEAKRFIAGGEKPATSDYMTKQVLCEIEDFMKRHMGRIRPAAFLCYNRVAMFGKKDSSFRITFDSDIMARRENLSLAAGCRGERLLPEGSFLMEVKFSGAMPLAFAAILSELKIYSRSFSKIGAEYKELTRSRAGSEASEAAGIKGDVCVLSGWKSGAVLG